MKRILFILTIALLPLSVYAQNDPGKQQRLQRIQQIQSAKIAFFTAEIQLTPKEAEEFWPLYNEYWKERDALMRKTQKAMLEIHASVKGGDVKQGPELVKLLESYISSSTEEGLFTEHITISSTKFYQLRRLQNYMLPKRSSE